MKNYKKISCLIIIMSLLLTNMAMPTHVEAKVYEDSNHSIELSDYDYTVHITDEEMIKEIAADYGLQSDEDIEEIIYVPISEDTDFDCESGIATVEWGAPELYIKQIGEEEEKGALLRSSWYEAPGGTMAISESVETSYTLSVETSLTVEGVVIEGLLKGSYGFNVTKAISITDTQNVSVKAGCKRNVKAYVNNMVYEYELWEDDVFFDDKIGGGEIAKPIGVIFTIGKNTAK